MDGGHRHDRQEHQGQAVGARPHGVSVPCGWYDGPNR
jgi:hypothetical protein